MGNDENGGRVAIIVAIIGLIGALAVALIAKLPIITFEKEISKTDSVNSSKLSKSDTTNKIHGEGNAVKMDSKHSVIQKTSSKKISNNKSALDKPLNADNFCSLLIKLNTERKDNYQNVKASQVFSTNKNVTNYNTTLSTEFVTSLQEFIIKKENKKYSIIGIEIKSSNKALYNDICNTIENCLKIKIKRGVAGNTKEGVVDFADGGYIDIESNLKETDISFGQIQSL